MDNAVGLVQAYLHVNGFFTVTEYPVLEALEGGGVQSATDIDIIALRLPRAGGLVTIGSGRGADFRPDPALGVATDRGHLLIGEVKEGAPTLNRGATNPKVLRAVLSRFACCSTDAVASAVDRLLQNGEATVDSGIGLDVRLIAFGTGRPTGRSRSRVVQLDHVVEFLHEHLNRHWDLLRHAQIKDQTFGFLVMLEKARRRGRKRSTNIAGK
ncbi:MAG: hypothetical protein R2910_05480 [Gemmatimonadales bacterium]